jgi:hypothetical protein
MSTDIFISFASQDRKVASTLCTSLENRGFNCWIATRDILPGENFQTSIVQAIRRAKIMLLVFTANSNNSQEMTKELAIASQQKLIVIPLRVEDVAPSDAFAYEFATRQWIDLFADWEFALDQLCQRIGNAISYQGARSPAEAKIDESAPQAAPETTEEQKSTPAPGWAARAQYIDTSTEASLDEPSRRPKTWRWVAAFAAAVVAIIAVGLTIPAMLKSKPPGGETPPMAIVKLQQAAPPLAPATMQAAQPVKAVDQLATIEAKPDTIAGKKTRASARRAAREIPY